MINSEQSTLNTLSTQLVQPTRTSQIEQELVNAIRQGKLVEVRYSELTPEERRAAHVALFHQGGW